MQNPIIVFDHVKKVVTVAQPGPVYNRKMVEALAAQRAQVTGSAGKPAR